MAENSYTVSDVTTQAIPISSFGLLDSAGVFPTTYKLVITPDVGADILAREFKVGVGSIPMALSYNGDTNSHTAWPSKFQWHMGGSSSINPVPENPSFPTISGLTEWPAFYKIVFQDSNNLTNDPNFAASPNSAGNEVWVWLYFGKTEITPIHSLVDLSVVIDIDRNVIDPMVEQDTINPTTGGVLININNSSI